MDNQKIEVYSGYVPIVVPITPLKSTFFQTFYNEMQHAEHIIDFDLKNINGFRLEDCSDFITSINKSYKTIDSYLKSTCKKYNNNESNPFYFYYELEVIKFKDGYILNNLTELTCDIMCAINSFIDNEKFHTCQYSILFISLFSIIPKHKTAIVLDPYRNIINY